MTVSTMPQYPEHVDEDSKDHAAIDQQNTSRRQLLALAGTAILAGMAAPTFASAAEGEPMIHMFAFRWKPVATEEQKNRAIKEISAFRGKIPGLLEVYVGKNTSPRGAGYETGGVMKFTDAAALAAYTVHPQHKALLAWLLPLIDPVEVDFSA
jgi:hypothetical protein